MENKRDIIVQSLWIGEKLSYMENLCIKSFIEHGYTFHLYTYNNFSVPNKTIVLDANNILNKTEIFEYKDGGVSAFSNVFRYKLLYEKGGIWVDMDLICLKRFNTENDYIFSSELSKNKIHANVGFIKVPKKSKLMKLCYVNSLIVKKFNPKWGDLGPKLFVKYIKKLQLNKYVMEPFYFCPIGYNDIDKICDLDNNLDLIKDSYCVHLWNGVWYRNKMDKNILSKIKIFKLLTNNI